MQIQTFGHLKIPFENRQKHQKHIKLNKIRKKSKHAIECISYRAVKYFTKYQNFKKLGMPC